MLCQLIHLSFSCYICLGCCYKSKVTTKNNKVLYCYCFFIYFLFIYIFIFPIFTKRASACEVAQHSRVIFICMGLYKYTGKTVVHERATKKNQLSLAPINVSKMRKTYYKIRCERFQQAASYANQVLHDCSLRPFCFTSFGR